MQMEANKVRFDSNDAFNNYDTYNIYKAMS